MRRSYENPLLPLSDTAKIGLAVGGVAIAGLLVYLVWPKSAAGSTPITKPPPLHPLPPQTCPPGQFLDIHGYCQDIAPSNPPSPSPSYLPYNWSLNDSTSVTLHVGQSINFNFPQHTPPWLAMKIQPVNILNTVTSKTFQTGEIQYIATPLQAGSVDITFMTGPVNPQETVTVHITVIP